MRRVAFLSFDWDFEIMSSYYEGMQAYLDERACDSEGSDTQLIIFNAFGQYANYAAEEGALEIFSLCDLSHYDGFIIQGNRTWPPAMRQRVADEIVALGKPLVSINYELMGAHYVGTDNHDAMYGLVKRVLTDRGCTKVALVNGLETSWEAQARARACRHACADLGVFDVRFYQAGWDTEEGVAAALKMLESPDDLPEVVFCCNDNLAVGVQETLQSRGVRVPDDVMITGFDNRELSLKATPRITTIDRDYTGIGRTAMDVLEQLMAGEELPQQVSSQVRYVLAESCGYVGKAESKADLVDDLYAMDYALRHFYQVLMRFQPAVLGANTLPEILRECERYLHEVRCPNVYLVINDNYLELETPGLINTNGAMSLLMAHTGSDLGLVYDNQHIYARYLSREILPPDISMDHPLYMVFPLHHNATCIGTLVTEGVSPIMKYGFLTIILTLLSGAIESVRKKEQLQAVNARLDDLYVRDQLTGMFNRFALDRFGPIVFEHLLRDFSRAQFILVDVDYMRRINDACGHEIGDRALQDAAGVIQRAIRDENAFALRYGGDEFLIICRRDLVPKLEGELQMHKRNSVRPYDLSLSVGRVQVMANEHLTLREAIERATARMSQVKRDRPSAKA